MFSQKDCKLIAVECFVTIGLALLACGIIIGAVVF